MITDIRKYVEELDYQEVQKETVKLLWDTKTHIGVFLERIDADLEVGEIYEFNFERYDEWFDHFVVMKKMDAKLYLLATCHDTGLGEWSETCLERGWIACDVQAEYGINFEDFSGKTIKNDEHRYDLEEAVDLIAELIRLRLNHEGERSSDGAITDSLVAFADGFNRIMDAFVEECSDTLCDRIKRSLSMYDEEDC